MNKISVIVTTYNWSSALNLCLHALFAQQDRDFEIIIADDGSNEESMLLNKALYVNSPIPIKYVYHQDDGFRAATIRNKAVTQSEGEYIIFIDGDCIVRPNFISKHRQLAEQGYFVPGNRVLLNQAYTDEIIKNNIILYDKSWWYFISLKLQKKINRILPFLLLPLGRLRKLWPNKWQSAMTCNLAVWKNDFLCVNGFDEVFQGWGFEDSDLIIRLIHVGIKRKEGRFAVPVLHLWHPQNDRSEHDNNYQRLLLRLQQSDFIMADKGISQYIK